jgi:prevent-host-death family protein
MPITNIHEAKTHFSKLIEQVEAGEEVIIARAGRPVARLVKFENLAKPVRRPGSMRGKIRIMPGFDRLDKVIEAQFSGEANEASA